MPKVTAKKKAARPRSLRIEGEMTIYRARELKGELLKQLERCRELEINLQGVSELDSAGVQLLVLVAREARRAGTTLRFTAHSAAAREAIELLGLLRELGESSDVASAQGAIQ